MSRIGTLSAMIAGQVGQQHGIDAVGIDAVLTKPDQSQKKEGQRGGICNPKQEA